MALFGYPRAQENDAERAARAALAILRALEDLNARNAGKALPALAARIGLESGPVVVDATGEVFGEAPNVAARVQSAAEPGTSGHRGRAAPDRRPVRRRGQGRARTQRRARQGRALSRRARERRRPARRRARAHAARWARGGTCLLTRRWERARRGEGQFVQIVGEPGLGKSRLIEEFRARLGGDAAHLGRVGVLATAAEHAAASRSPNGAARASAAPRSPAKSASPNSRRRSRWSGSTRPNTRRCWRR